ncbi:MAG TPA: low molecular weight protein arginine phosphatase [Opitutus sp.]|nr:low molecular weight protein arginine phosphatase [Opitutus sp.]
MPDNVLVVCTANICRSPMAAGLLQHALAAQPEPLRSMKVSSAGIAAREGDAVSENSVIALRKVGIDISRHVSRPVTQALLNDSAVVVCMTELHRAMIQLQADPAPKHVYLLCEFMPPGSAREIADPYGSSLKTYEICRDEIVEAIPSLVEFLKTCFAPPSAA